MLKFTAYSLAGIVGISLIWRFASMRYTIPCPAWIGKMIAMENPLAKDYFMLNKYRHILNK